MASTSTNTGAKTEVKDDSEKLIKDILNGEPVVSKLLTGVATGDPNAMNTIVAQGGYNITDEGVNKVLASTSAGPTFDIRMGKLKISYQYNTRS
jgi:hypothetical protein